MDRNIFWGILLFFYYFSHFMDHNSRLCYMLNSYYTRQVIDIQKYFVPKIFLKLGVRCRTTLYNSMGQGIKLHFDFSKHNGQNLWTYICLKNDTSRGIYFLMKCLDLNHVCRFYEYPSNATMVKLKEENFQFQNKT